MSSINSVSVSPIAYKKLILHTAKYPTARVLGLLLASQHSSSLIIVDSIPLSHHWTSLSPMAEVALSLATAYASSKSLCIVGIYEAPELISERNPSRQATKLTSKIADLNGKEALLILVNNATLLNVNNNSLSAYTVTGGGNDKGQEVKPKGLTGSTVTLEDEKTVLGGLEALVRNGKTWEGLVDFDAASYHKIVKAVK
uniref:MPN domain-containing protein n=1 Tax=Melanopsichium pennsylvanicum 4 TaxID=1398559 RepID=A0A077R2N9_9BASI|nr:conserved hypothetical protein [Melanopsichium pennsylvanicum 4]